MPRLGEITAVPILIDPSADDLRASLARGPVLVVSDRTADVVAAAVDVAHAWGVVPSSADASTIAAARAAVDAGLVVRPPVLAAAASDRHASAPRRATLDDGVVESLTPREVDVLQRLAEGLPNRAIASALGISDHTVKFHLASIFGKLGAATRTEAVRIGLRRALIRL